MTHPTPTHKGTAIMEDEKRTDLIARLESATEGSRELDEAIVRALYPEAIVDFYIYGDDEKAVHTVFHARPLIADKSELPFFTTPLDAALTLVPEGCDWEILRTTESVARNEAFIYSPTFMICNDEDRIYGEANTPALALCIAALKAKDSTDGR